VVSSRRANAGLWLPILNRRLRHPNSNHIPDGTADDQGGLNDQGRRSHAQRPSSTGLLVFAITIIAAHRLAQR
jgi:hypothetical protein